MPGAPLRVLRRRVLLAWVLLLAAALFALSPPEAGAQREDLLTREACRINPSSEDCICRDVRVYSRMPAGEINWSDRPPTALHAPDYTPVPGEERLPPFFDEELGVWAGDDRDFETVENSRYKAHCARAYFRENLRRLVYIFVAVAGALFAATLGWAGFVHMQETATGQSRSTARTVILRAFIGIVILAGAFIAWEAVSGLFMDGFNLWEDDAGVIDSF